MNSPRLQRLVTCLIAATALWFTVGGASACTIFYVSDGKNIFAGNNEDYTNLATKVWFIPAGDGKHGRMIFGYDDYVRQGGMNDVGLFFDTMGGPAYDMPHLKDSELYSGDVIAEAFEYCATVDEVIAYYEEHGPFIDNRDTLSVYGAIMYGDRFGNSVIVEGDKFVRKEGRFQVMTNFFQTRPELGGFPCTRYEIATNMLERHETYNVDIMRSVLEAVHIEPIGGWNPTLYTNIYDLKSGVAYLYHFHNFETVVTFNLAEELAKGEHEYDIPDLFPPTMAEELYIDSRSRGTLSKLLELAAEIGPGASMVVVGVIGAVFLLVAACLWGLWHLVSVRRKPDVVDARIG